MVVYLSNSRNGGTLARGQFLRCGLLFLIASLSLPAGAVVCSYLPPKPSGIVKVTRPTLCFKVFPNGDARITKVYLALNQTPVAASYSPAKKEVLYQPLQPLPPGEYQVNCRVVFDENEAYPFEKAWRFTVAPDAISELPEPTARQITLLEAVNAIRHSLGQPSFVLSKALCAAAQAHSRYAWVNRAEEFHEEMMGKPWVTGVFPQDRADNFGFVDPVSEDGSTGAYPSLTAPIVKLFDAPYHRPPFLEPEACALGTGSEGETHGDLATTLEFGQSDTDTTMVSPIPGQQQVPTAWLDNESPDPLRIHPPHSPSVGYPLVFVHFGPGKNRIAVAGASLTTADGDAVAIFLNTPDNDDHLTNIALLIPQNPLRPDTTYHVSVHAATDEGADISREWDFTTGPDPDGVHKPSARVKVAIEEGSLLVRFPKTVANVQCYFDASSVLTKSSPAVHADQGMWLARYPIPPSARTYRLVIVQGTWTHMMQGFLSEPSRVKHVIPRRNHM